MSKTAWGWIGMLTAALVMGAATGIFLTYAILFTVALIGDTVMRFSG